MLQSPQQPQQEAFPPDGWITKAEAARRLKLSEPRVAALALKGTLETRKERNPDSHQLVTLFNAVSVDRFGFRREHPGLVIERPDDEVIGDVALLAKPELPEKPAAEPTQALAPVAPAVPVPVPVAVRPLAPEIPKPWLTLDEAAECGLTKKWLKTEAEAGEKRGIRDMGKHSPGGRWRFHRDYLEKL